MPTKLTPAKPRTAKKKTTQTKRPVAPKRIQAILAALAAAYPNERYSVLPVRNT